jgi:putative tricarboxylic transport membrane protein
VIRVRDPRNFGCALMFIGLAGLLAYNALQLTIGTASAMGPGYFPLALAIVLGALGVVLGMQSLRIDGPRMAGVEWRGFALVTLALVTFGATITRLGFVPAVLLTTGLAMAASRTIRPRTAAVLAIVLLAFCWAVFVAGLGLPVRLFGA